MLFTGQVGQENISVTPKPDQVVPKLLWPFLDLTHKRHDLSVEVNFVAEMMMSRHLDRSDLCWK